MRVHQLTFFCQHFVVRGNRSSNEETMKLSHSSPSRSDSSAVSLLLLWGLVETW